VSTKSVNEIAAVVSNEPLAKAIARSVNSAIAHPRVHLVGGKSIRSVFRRSLDAAVRDIRSHPRGRLFQRLIEHGPCKPEEVESATSGGEGTLSLDECASCVQFIFSHMVNRFKGELAELLAVEPCIQLMEQLESEGRVQSAVDLYCGEMVQERRRIRTPEAESTVVWSGYVKGADGLMVNNRSPATRDGLDVVGIIEVKSMVLPWRRVARQIGQHIARLEGGLKLGKKAWAEGEVRVARPIRIAIMPSTWKVAREWRSESTGRSRRLVFPEPCEPPVQTQIEQLDTDNWRIALAWSEEALEQAAYEMTFRYMSQVGECVYVQKPLPKTWDYMTPSEAGYNAIKEALYYILLLNMPERQDRLATKLYNVYCFGYALGAGSRDMLWPEDFPDGD